MNNRIYYACQALAISPYQATPVWTTLRGLQSAGINTKFNLQQIYEIGQLAIYQNYEDVPDVEVTVEKVLDGYCPAYCLATSGAPASTLIGRSNQRAHIAMSLYADTTSLASGAPNQEVVMSGMYVSQVGYNFATTGPFTENVTFVGNTKVWQTGAFDFSGFTSAHGVVSLAPSSASGVNFRQHIDLTASRFPTQIPGINASGQNLSTATSGAFDASIQSVKTSCNLGRDQILELGRKNPYFRFMKVPADTSTSIEIIAKVGDLINCYETTNSTKDEIIKLKTQEGTAIDLGSKNRLQSVNYGGANAGGGGGNATVTFQYIGFNDFDVRHPADPNGYTPTF